MYCYDEYDQRMIDERVAQYRDQVRRRLSNELTETEFLPLRLQNGLYMQIHGYMLRIAVPYGLISSRQMRMFAHIARKYDRGYGHFTTRQNIQFNWLKLEDTPDILADLIRRRSGGMTHSLAAALVAWGQGRVPAQWRALAEMSIPVLAVCGAEDPVYRGRIDRMKRESRAVRGVVIENAGHTVHVEQPEALARVVKKFLEEEERAG